MTLREAYIEGIIALLKTTAGFPALVERSLSIAFTREESPVIVIHRGGGDLERTLSGEAYRTCEILVSIVTRSNTPDKDSDGVMEIAHPLIMSFRGSGWVDIRELGTDSPHFSNADGQACMITTRYQIEYRTLADSLTG